MPPAGFPHSDIHGSLSAFDSPWLFADRCVLLRLSVPRHPPCALLSLTCSILSYACVQFLLESQFWVLIGKICSARLLSQARLPLICFTFFRYLYPVFKVPLTSYKRSRKHACAHSLRVAPKAQYASGGLKWTRTIDLTLIRRAL